MHGIALVLKVIDNAQAPHKFGHIFIGKVLWLHAREDLIDTELYRVRLQNYFPVARFGASYYIRTRDRFSLGPQPVGAPPNPIDEIC